MGKPSCEVFGAFGKAFEKYSKDLKSPQFLVSYYMSSHPGSRLSDAVALAEYMRDNNILPEQVQDFYPTPGTLATCMYHTGLNPLTMKPIYTAKSAEEKQMQRALLQYRYSYNHETVRQALKKCHREDLIGYGKKCLVPPAEKKSSQNTSKKKGAGTKSAPPKKTIRNTHKKKN